VEAGALEVRVAGGGRVLRGGADGGAGTPAANDAGLEAVLYPGDAAVVPPGVRHALAQRGTEPAVALGATLVFVGTDRDGRPRQELAPFFPPGGAVRESPQPTPPAVQPLAGGAVAAWPTGPVRVALGRAVLGPGARLVPPDGETVLVAVEAGTLGVAGGGGRAAAGEGALLPAGPGRGLRNAGDGLLVLVVLTVAPAAA
jgi:hypothetical protein